MSRAAEFLRTLCYIDGGILLFTTVLRLNQGDMNALFIVIPALLSFVAGRFYSTDKEYISFWSLLISGGLGYVMLFNQNPYYPDPVGTVLMKFLLLAFPQTVILILTIKIKGLILYPKDESVIQAKAPFSLGKDTKPVSPISHHDVFISHAQADKPIADAVCARLEASNIRCWIAPRDVPPGKDFPEAIIEGIEASRVMVLIFSAHSNNSKHVIRELTSAVSKGLTIVPLRIEDVIPSKSMEYLIGLPHWLDALTPPLEQHVERLVIRISHILSDTEDVLQ
jgi:hypothetical protein